MWLAEMAALQAHRKMAAGAADFKVDLYVERLMRWPADAVREACRKTRDFFPTWAELERDLVNFCENRIQIIEALEQAQIVPKEEISHRETIFTLSEEIQAAMGDMHQAEWLNEPAKYAVAQDKLKTALSQFEGLARATELVDYKIILTPAKKMAEDRFQPRLEPSEEDKVSKAEKERRRLQFVASSFDDLEIEERDAFPPYVALIGIRDRKYVGIPQRQEVTRFITRREAEAFIESVKKWSFQMKIQQMDISRLGDGEPKLQLKLSDVTEGDMPDLMAALEGLRSTLNAIMGVPAELLKEDKEFITQGGIIPPSKFGLVGEVGPEPVTAKQQEEKPEILARIAKKSIDVREAKHNKAPVDLDINVVGTRIGDTSDLPEKIKKQIKSKPRKIQRSKNPIPPVETLLEDEAQYDNIEIVALADGNLVEVKVDGRPLSSRQMQVYAKMHELKQPNGRERPIVTQSHTWLARKSGCPEGTLGYVIDNLRQRGLIERCTSGYLIMHDLPFERPAA